MNPIVRAYKECEEVWKAIIATPNTRKQPWMFREYRHGCPMCELSWAKNGELSWTKNGELLCVTCPLYLGQSIACEGTDNPYKDYVYAPDSESRREAAKRFLEYIQDDIKLLESLETLRGEAWS
jgi:hypothetical protein